MKDKLKKLLIPIIVVIVVLIMIGCVLFKFVLTDKAKNEDKNNIENNEVNTVDTNYTAYISINPLIKLTFKVSCKDNVCSEPLVIDYELVNDDAKEIYNDIDFSKTNGELSNVLLLIAQTARDSEVEFNTVDVYSDYSIINDYIDVHEEITSNWSFSVNVVNKEEIDDIGTNLEEARKTFTITFNSNGGSKVASQNVFEGEKVSAPMSPTKSGYTFVEWQLDGIKYNFNNEVVNDIELKAIWKKNKVETEEKPSNTDKDDENQSSTDKDDENQNTGVVENPNDDDQNTDNPNVPPVVEEKPIGSYVIPNRKAVCEQWTHEIDGEIITGTSLNFSEVSKYVDMWTNYYGYFYTDPNGYLYIAEGLAIIFDEYGRVMVTDELCDPNYGAPLYQWSSNEYIRNYVKYFNIGFDNNGIPTSNITSQYGYKIKCTKTTCWYY